MCPSCWLLLLFGLKRHKNWVRTFITKETPVERREKKKREMRRNSEKESILVVRRNFNNINSFWKACSPKITPMIFCHLQFVPIFPWSKENKHSTYNLSWFNWKTLIYLCFQIEKCKFRFEKYNVLFVRDFGFGSSWKTGESLPTSVPTP